MNKVMLYVGLAILLGTLTMVAPLALLEPSNTSPEDNNLLTTPEYVGTVPGPAESNEEEKFFGGDNSPEAGNYSVQTTTPEPAPATPAPSESDSTRDVTPEETELVLKTADNHTDLSPVGLMAVPSFFVALGVFVYLRKRIS
jgi:hypothetical protein